MKMEETMSNNSNSNVGLLNDLLAKMSDDPNESVESRFGRLIDQYFEGETQRFLTCMERPLASHQLFYYLKNGSGAPNAKEPVFVTCPHCRKAEEHLVIGNAHWYICHQHRVRWQEKRELLSPGQWDTECVGVDGLEELEEEYEKEWDRIKDYRELKGSAEESAPLRMS
jgi:hypothetical protein